MESLLAQYKSVIECLEKLVAPGNPLAARAAGLQMQLSRVSTLLALKMSLCIFKPLEMLSHALQSSFHTISGMMRAVDEMKAELAALRFVEEFQTVLAETTKQQESMNLHLRDLRIFCPHFGYHSLQLCHCLF